VAIAALVVAILAWRKPKNPPPLPKASPDLRLEQVGGIGSQTGSPREYVKTQLRLVNEGAGEASNWQIAIRNDAGPGVVIAREPHRGSRLVADEIAWHQDASTGVVPPGQHRDLPDWLYAEAPPGTKRVAFPYSMRAEGMVSKEGQMLVSFATDPSGVDVQFLL